MAGELASNSEAQQSPSQRGRAWRHERKEPTLTRGDLGGEGPREVSRGRSSEESRGNPEGAKGRRSQYSLRRTSVNGEQAPGNEGA